MLFYIELAIVNPISIPVFINFNDYDHVSIQKQIIGDCRNFSISLSNDCLGMLR